MARVQTLPRKPVVKNKILVKIDEQTPENGGKGILEKKKLKK